MNKPRTPPSSVIQNFYSKDNGFVRHFHVPGGCIGFYPERVLITDLQGKIGPFPISNHAQPPRTTPHRTSKYLPQSYSSTCFLSSCVVRLCSSPPGVSTPKGILAWNEKLSPLLSSLSPFLSLPLAELAAHLAKKRTNKVQLRGWLVARRISFPPPPPHPFFTLSYLLAASVGCPPAWPLGLLIRSFPDRRMRAVYS